MTKELATALEQVEAELAAAQREFLHVRNRIEHLSNAASGLRGVLGVPDPGADPDLARKRRLFTAANQRKRELATDDTPDDPTSTDRVVEILSKAGKPMPRGWILQQFDRNGWIDPAWKEPGAAIRMAIRRAVERGEVQQLPDGHFLAQPTPLFAATAEGGEPLTTGS